MGSGKLDDNELDLETAGGYVPPKRSTLIVDTEGGQAPIRQGDMSDAQFAALTKQTAEAGKLVAVEHPDGSRTDGKSLVESFGKGRPIIGPDGSLIQTGGDNQTNLPTISGAEGGGGQSAETAAAERAMHEKYARENPGRSLPNQFGDALANSVVQGFGMKGVFDALGPVARRVADYYTQPPVVDPGIAGPAPGVEPGTPRALGPDDVRLQSAGEVRASVRGAPGTEEPVPPNINLAPGDYGLGEAKKSLDMQSQAAKQSGDAMSEYYDNAAVHHYQAAQKLLDYDDARRKVEANMAEDHQRTQAAFAKLDQQIEDASHAKVDTRRYFSNMDTGQQVAAVLAGACFGAIGQGTQWLQHVKSLVDQDIEAQKSDHENNLRGLTLKRENLKDMYSMARQAGLDGLTAVEHAKASMMQKMALDLQFWSDNANGQLAKSNALAMQGKLMGEYATHKATAAAHADSMRVHKAQMEMQLYHFQLQDKWNEDKLALQAMLKTGGKAILPTAEEGKRIAQLVSLGELGANTYREFEKAVGKAPAPLAKVQDVLGFGGVSDANAYETATAPQATQNIGKSLEGKMTDADAIRISSGFVPHPGDTENRVNAKKRAYVSAAVEKYKATLDAIEGRGADVSGFPTPEAYAAHIAKKIGIAVADEGKPTTLVRPGGK